MGYRLRRVVKASELGAGLALGVRGDDTLIETVSALEDAGCGTLTFSKSGDGIPAGSVCVAQEDVVTKQTVIISASPRLDFIRALDWLDRNVGFAMYESKPQIHPTAIIGDNVVIESGCVVGENVVIEHNVVIQKGTTIGARSRIRSNASIGGDGFGFERLADGSPIRFVHLGGVRIGCDVEIGANTCVARGTLGDTIIEDGVKIDNLVHIAHNVHVKRGAFVIACAEVSGGVVIGENTWVGPNASVIQKLTLGDGSLVGIGAVVTKDMDPYAVHVGNPARFLKSLKPDTDGS